MASSSSSHSHQIQLRPKATIEALESSVQHLVTNWQRRQRWHCLLILSLFSPFISTHHDEISTNNNNRPKWRTNLFNLLNSLPVHVATILLLLLDLTLTILDLSSSSSCSSYKNTMKDKEEVVLFYHWAGIGILSLLSARVALLALALGLRSFLTSPGLVVDGVVMVGALVLEAAAGTKGAGLLVVVSLWRVVRVAESAFELSNEAAIEAQIEGVVEQLEVLREENRHLEEELGRLRVMRTAA